MRGTPHMLLIYTGTKPMRYIGGPFQASAPIEEKRESPCQIERQGPAFEGPLAGLLATQPNSPKRRQAVPPCRRSYTKPAAGHLFCAQTKSANRFTHDDSANAFHSSSAFCDKSSCFCKAITLTLSS